MQVNGSLAPRSIESCLFIIFHGWNTIEAGHVLRGSSSSSSSRDENGMCGASELQVVVVVFPFSLPISFAPFLRREVQESLLYPVVWAGRKPRAVCVPQDGEQVKKTIPQRLNLSFFFFFFNQTTQHFLYYSSVVYHFFFLSRLFGVFLSPSFLHLISLMPLISSYADSYLIQDHISLWYTQHVTRKTAGLYLPSNVSWF